MIQGAVARSSLTYEEVNRKIYTLTYNNNSTLHTI